MELNWAQQAIPIEVTELPSTGWSWQVVITMVASLTAVVISVVTWVRSGPIVKAKASIQWKGYGPASYEVVFFSIANSGRSETQLVEICMKSGGALFPLSHHEVELPLELKPGSESSFDISVQTLCRKIGWRKSENPGLVSIYFRTGHQKRKVKMRKKDRVHLTDGARDLYEKISARGREKATSENDATINKRAGR